MCSDVDERNDSSHMHVMLAETTLGNVGFYLCWAVVSCVFSWGLKVRFLVGCQTLPGNHDIRTV